MSEVSGIDVECIMSRSRLRNAVTCRYLLFWYMYYELCLSTPMIGRILNRDHATVLHGLSCAHDFLTLPTYDNERQLYFDFIETVMIHENEC